MEITKLQMRAANIYVKNHHVGQMKQSGSHFTAFGFILCQYVTPSTDGETEAQSGSETCPGSQGWKVGVQGLGSGAQPSHFVLFLFPPLNRASLWAWSLHWASSCPIGGAWGLQATTAPKADSHQACGGLLAFECMLLPDYKLWPTGALCVGPSPSTLCY